MSMPSEISVRLVDTTGRLYAPAISTLLGAER